jgi:peptidoglycan/xylan/chitin deacetylase (PgdA/CDA1 family)/MoaA/NifB/PqqE/SkfB family radical SAM enzyme
VRAGSRYRRGIEPDVYRESMRRILERHRWVLDQHGTDVLAAKESFLVSLLAHQDSLLRQRTGVILAYHRIASLFPDTHRLCVAPARFRAHLRWLRERCTPMRLTDLAQAARAGALPPRAVALTFDDGYLDALSTAAPMLVEQGIPATFFVNTERLDEAHEAWHDEVERVLLGPARLPELLELGGLSLPARTPEQRRHALHALHGVLMPAARTEREQLLKQLFAWSGLPRAPRPERRLMTAEEVLQLSRMPGCDIGSHSANHLDLPRHPREVQKRELLEAKQRLETLVQRPVPAFAYPFGERSAEVAREVHALAVTVEPGVVAAGTDPLLLPRLEAADGDADELAAAMDALFAGRPAPPPAEARARRFGDNERLAADQRAAGREVLSARPRFLIIGPTSRCNARCVMCPVSFRAPGDKGADMPGEVFEKLAPLIPTAAHLNLFSTGEPTIAREIERILEEARRLRNRHAPLWLSTNGKRLPPGLLELLMEPGTVLQFSVDGGTREVFEAVRRGIGFDELCASLALVRARKGKLAHPRVVFSSTISRRNLHDLGAIFALAKEYGVEHVNFYEADPEAPEEVAFSLDESDRPLFEKQLPAIEASGIAHSNGLAFRKTRLEAPLRCVAPWTVFHARADGTVRTCCTLRRSMGDLRQQSVEEIWNGPEYRRLRRAFVTQQGIPDACFRCTDPLRTQ